MTETRDPAGPSSRRYAYAALAAIGIYLLALGALFRPAGGLLGHYSTLDREGREIEVHQRVDERIDFPVPQRLDAAYIFNWSMVPLGFPSARPPYRIHWSGLLRVPLGGVYGFAAQARGEVEMRLDGAAVDLAPDGVTDLRLEAGLHPVEIDYSLDRDEAQLVWRWRPPGGALRVVGESFLAPDRAALVRGRWRRGWGWFLLAAGAAAAALAAFGVRRGGGRAARWAAALSAEKTVLVLGLVLMLAAVLRFHDYALVPFHHETADEYQHAWEGWHLLHERVPAAWSTFPDSYPEDQRVDFRWFGDRYIVVRPYFDHPPLYSILIGLVTSLAGPPTYRAPWDFLSCSLPVMRVVPILLSLAGILLLHRLAIAYGASPRAALLAVLVYAVLPPIVMAHRLVKAESLLALLFMGAVLAARHGPPEPGGRGGGVVAGLLSGLAIWTKATGVAVAATVLVVFLARRRYRDAAIAIAMTAGFLLLYLLYAWSYDFNIFFDVIRAQATSKWVSLDAVLDLLGGKVVVKWFGRGWYLWLLLATGIAALRRERRLLLPIALYATLIALTADHRVVYGWYRIPLYPFLCVAAGVYLDDMLREADLYRAFPFAVTAVSTGLLYALPAGLAHSRGLMILFATVSLAPFLLREVLDRPLTRRLARGGVYLLLVLFLAGCLASVGGLLEIYAAGRGVQ